MLRELKVNYHELFAIPHHLISVSLTDIVAQWSTKHIPSATCYLIFISLNDSNNEPILREKQTDFVGYFEPQRIVRSQSGGPVCRLAFTSIISAN